ARCCSPSRCRPGNCASRRHRRRSWRCSGDCRPAMFQRRELCFTYYAHHSIVAMRGTIMRIERELMRGAGPVAVMQLLEDGEKYGDERVNRLEKQSIGVLARWWSTVNGILS